LDSFTGASDDLKLDAALTYVAAQTQKPAIMIPVGRMPTFTTTGRALFSGLKIIGPPVVGFQNVEQSGGALNPTRIRVNVGTGTSSWFVGTGNVFNVYFADLSIESTNSNSQFIEHKVANGTLYAGTFRNLSFQAFKHVLGNTTDALSITLCSFTGDWNMTTAKGCQVNLAGSDNVNLWRAGSLNVGPAGNGSVLGAGEYLVKLSTAKTKIGGIYITADDQFRALLLQGNMTFQAGNLLTGFVIEGRNKDDPATGALVRCTGGGWRLEGSELNYAMASPATYTDATDRAYIHQTGGNLHVVGPTMDRTEGQAVTMPLLLASGGEAIVRQAQRGTKTSSPVWGTNRPVVQQTTAGLIIDTDATVTLTTAA
jgi:hypothetical protein